MLHFVIERNKNIHVYRYSVSEFIYLSTLIVETQQFNQQYHALTCADPEGGGGGGAGGPDPPDKSPQKRFLSYTGPNTLKNHKDTKPAFNIGPSSVHQRNAI